MPTYIFMHTHVCNTHKTGMAARTFEVGQLGEAVVGGGQGAERA